MSFWYQWKSNLNEELLDKSNKQLIEMALSEKKKFLNWIKTHPHCEQLRHQAGNTEVIYDVEHPNPNQRITIFDIPSSHNKKSAYFKRDNLEGSFNEHKKDQTILSITDYLILFSNSLYEDCICPLFSTGSFLSNPLIFLHLWYIYPK